MQKYAFYKKNHAGSELFFTFASDKGRKPSFKLIIRTKRRKINGEVIKNSPHKSQMKRS